MVQKLANHSARTCLALDHTSERQAVNAGSFLVLAAVGVCRVPLVARVTYRLLPSRPRRGWKQCEVNKVIGEQTHVRIGGVWLFPNHTAEHTSNAVVYMGCFFHHTLYWIRGLTHQLTTSNRDTWDFYKVALGKRFYSTFWGVHWSPIRMSMYHHVKTGTSDTSNTLKCHINFITRIYRMTLRLWIR